MPAHGEAHFSGPHGSLVEFSTDAFGLRMLSPKQHAAQWKALQQMLKTDSKELGKAGIDSEGGVYNELRLAKAWSLDHKTQRAKYDAGLQLVADQMALIAKKVRLKSPPAGLPCKTQKAANALAAANRRFLRAEANEQMLIHGVPCELLLTIISTGVNERFSGTSAGASFGDGIYLAEDIGKCDQYADGDHAHAARTGVRTGGYTLETDPLKELHRRLYPTVADHPKDVHYVLICRVAMGHSIRTQKAGENAKSMDCADKPVFPVGFRELGPVEGVTPALCAEIGSRMRPQLCT
jgi:hypothetical protein